MAPQIASRPSYLDSWNTNPYLTRTSVSGPQCIRLYPCPTDSDFPIGQRTRFIDAVLDATQDTLECHGTSILKEHLIGARRYGPLSDALACAFLELMRARLDASYSPVYLVPLETTGKMYKAKTRGQSIISPPGTHDASFWIPEVC